MTRDKFVHIITACFIVMVILYQLGCSKADQQGRVDFYIDLNNGNVTSTYGSSESQVSNYQELYITGGEVYVNGLIVFKGGDGYYYALSQFCPNDGCDVTYEVSFDRLRCPCDQSLFDVDGNSSSGSNTPGLYRYAASLNGTSLHVYTP